MHILAFKTLLIRAAWGKHKDISEMINLIFLIRTIWNYSVTTSSFQITNQHHLFLLPNHLASLLNISSQSKKMSNKNVNQRKKKNLKVNGIRLFLLLELLLAPLYIHKQKLYLQNANKQCFHRRKREKQIRISLCHPNNRIFNSFPRHNINTCNMVSTTSLNRLKSNRAIKIKPRNKNYKQ